MAEKKSVPQTNKQTKNGFSHSVLNTSASGCEKEDRSFLRFCKGQVTLQQCKHTRSVVESHGLASLWPRERTARAEQNTHKRQGKCVKQGSGVGGSWVGGGGCKS